ncbi:MAG: ADP-ribosylation factor-like protein [Promethearchaeota archaeon]
MSKKIVIIGPSAAGKTTLKKIFFEGESSTKLLQYALDPTFGEESLILRLMKEDIGIFDLSGQENQRWLETEEKSIFLDTKVIIVVIDVKTRFKDIIDFIRKIITLRNNITPSSIIYVLLHKIDLIDDQQELRVIKDEIEKVLSNKSLIKIFFTSIEKKYFIQTFLYFVDILKTCLQNDVSARFLDSTRLNEILKLVYQLDKEIAISKTDLQIKLNLIEKDIDFLIENLVKKGHIQFSISNDEKILSLTDKGREYFNDIINNFYFKDIFKDVIVSEVPEEVKIPPFIGYMIADKDGRSLLTTELYDGALISFLKKKNEVKNNNSRFDIELIPMFISALEKFSSEVNIQNLSGFNLKGVNLKMQIFSFNKFTVTFFANPNINLKSIEYEISNYFLNFFEKYDKEINIFLKTGSIKDIYSLNIIGRKWLEKLNKSYEHMIINLELFDLEHAKALYKELDMLHNEMNLNFSVTLEKIKKLKVHLMKAILEDNFDDLKVIAKKSQDFRLKYLT